MADTAAMTLDGNAIAGLLVHVFGHEMTTVVGTCATCGASAELGRLVVFTQAPGVVARCGTCRSVLMVLVTIREVTCVDVRGIASLEPPG